MEYLISHLLTNVLGPQLLPRAPWDPYAPRERGAADEDRPEAQRRALRDRGRREAALGGIVRTTVPIWSNEHAAGAVRPEYVPQS